MCEAPGLLLTLHKNPNRFHWFEKEPAGQSVIHTHAHTQTRGKGGRWSRERGGMSIVGGGNERSEVNERRQLGYFEMSSPGIFANGQTRFSRRCCLLLVGSGGNSVGVDGHGGGGGVGSVCVVVAVGNGGDGIGGGGGVIGDGAAVGGGGTCTCSIKFTKSFCFTEYFEIKS